MRTAARPRRGYTLMELVTASTLTLVACLGGLTAAQYSNRAAQTAAVQAQIRTIIHGLDQAAPTCNLEHALNVRAPSVTCAELAKEPLHHTGRIEGGTIAYRLDVEPLPSVPGVLQATTLFILPDSPPIKHVLFLHP